MVFHRFFTDGHSTGIYSWDMLYKLGSDYQTLWNNYLAECDSEGYVRKEPTQN